MELRKTVIVKETIEADDLGRASAPVVRVAALAVIRNPFAGKKADDLAPLFDMGGELGARLMDDLVALLGARRSATARRPSSGSPARWSTAAP